MPGRHRGPGRAAARAQTAGRVTASVGLSAGVAAGLVLGAGTAASAATSVRPAWGGHTLSVRDEDTGLSAVREWQARLSALGFPTSADGYFGPRTRASTAAFERSRHLAATGKVNAKDWDSAFAGSSSKKPSRNRTPLEAPAWPGRMTTRDVDTFRPAVRRWQRRMNELGYRLAEDGYYGPLSAAADRAFQQAHHLRATGVVNRATWAAVYTAKVRTGTAPGPKPKPRPKPKPPPVWKPPPPAVVPGMAGGRWVPSATPVMPGVPPRSLTTALENHWDGSVYAWQQRMAHLGYRIALDGSFGPGSKAVAAAFAKRAHLTGRAELAGTVDATAWRAAFAAQRSGAGVDARTRGLGEEAVSLAARERGAPYVYGGAGPRSFDCSGLVAFVFAQLGWDLPHNAQLQYETLAHIPVASLRPGDLIFFPDASGVMGHVGIYAGRSGSSLMMWDAPETGQRVQREPVWTTDVRAGRVG